MQNGAKRRLKDAQNGAKRGRLAWKNGAKQTSFAEDIGIMRPFMETKIKQRIITLNSGKALLVLGPPKVGKT